jgi:hypothetical protein
MGEIDSFPPSIGATIPDCPYNRMGEIKLDKTITYD